MDVKAIKFPFLKRNVVRTMGVLLILLLAIALLWHGNANSMQAEPALVADVYFEGEYRIADGPWKVITPGEHIPSTHGDVILRGNFHMLAPNGEYVGIYRGDLPIAFYTDHINLTFYEGDNEPFVIDMENPLYGSSACGVNWSAYTLVSDSEQTVEILIHNPHSYGNETAIDEMLSGIAFWTGIEFEKEVLNSGETQTDIGLLFFIVSLMFLGTALFSTLIHTKNTKIIWLLGIVIMFAGSYLTYSADGISFRNESIVSNTTLLGCSMMFYMLFLSMSIVQLMRVTRPVGTAVIVAVGIADSVFLLLPMLTDIRFYDTWLYWVIVQSIANAVLFGCLIKEFRITTGKERWIYIGLLLPLISFGVDAVMTALGFWKGGLVSTYVFMIFFIAAMVAVLKIIPQSINALNKAKELETDKLILNAQLTESRVSTMMSQIRPHFIYNTLGSIEQLCKLDPPKAGELVHNFAKYLRGNFGELDNPKPILMSKEMEHVRHYISIENVRFPDMTFTFEMRSHDFPIPALTVQPIVENAIKHGLMKLPKGGTIQVISYENDTDYCVLVEDNGVGFDTATLFDDRKQVGLRNIRERLKVMVNGSLEIESRVGEGTKVLIKIPKEVQT